MPQINRPDGQEPEQNGNGVKSIREIVEAGPKGQQQQQPKASFQDWVEQQQAQQIQM